MPTKNPRTMITFNDRELYEQVNEYRFNNRFKSQNDAVMDLINKGIEVLLGETPAERSVEISDDEKRFLMAYRAADNSARHYALQLLENNPSNQKNRA